MVLLAPLKASNIHINIFQEYLGNENGSAIFLHSINNEEVTNIISFLKSKKTSGPDSITHRILFLLKNEISKHLADLFNLSFTTSVFPSVPKNCESSTCF